jgi:hypothetical protein
MRLGAALSFFALGIAGLTLAAPGCGGDSTTETPGGGTTTPGDQTGKVPPAPEGSDATGTDERTFALNSLSLGEAERSGAANSNAWKKFGYNLDKRVTTASDSKSPDLANVCKRVSGAEASVHQDGDEGIDNAFGNKILKLISSFSTTPSKTVTDALLKGDFTILLTVKGLTDDANQTNTGLTGKILVGTKFGDSAPKFDMTEEWPYLDDPKIDVTGAYIKDGVFVNGQEGTDIRLSLQISGQALSLSINKAIITFKHADGELQDGTIAGIIKTTELTEGIRKIAGQINKDLCSGSTIDTILNSIKQSSDMMYAGDQDPTKECDAISIGIGFTAKQIKGPGEEKAPGAPPADNCAQ